MIKTCHEKLTQIVDVFEQVDAKQQESRLKLQELKLYLKEQEKMHSFKRCKLSEKVMKALDDERE